MKKKKKLNLPIIAFAVLAAGLFFGGGVGKASAATYYVDPVSGVDTNTGTIDLPIKSIEYAIENKIDGAGSDIVILRAGTYNNSSGLWKTGSDGQIIKSVTGSVGLRAYNEESVTIEMIATSANYFIYSSGNWTFDKLHFTNNVSTPSLRYIFAYRYNIPGVVTFNDCSIDYGNPTSGIGGVRFYSDVLSGTSVSAVFNRCRLSNFPSGSSIVYSNPIAGANVGVSFNACLIKNYSTILYNTTAGATSTLSFVNNTVTGGLSGISFQGLYSSSINTFKNNIFIANDVSAFLIWSSDTTPGAGWSVKNNVFYRPITQDPGGGEMDVIRAANGAFFPIDESNYYLDPMFADSANGDYTPTNSYIYGRGDVAALPTNGDINSGGIANWTGADIGAFKNNSAELEFPSLTNSVAFVGDSIAEGIGNRYVLNQIAGLPAVGTGLLGAAIGGSRIEVHLWLIDRAVMTWNPKYIVIESGNNTIRSANNVPSGTTALQAAAYEEAIIKKCLYWGVTPVWLGMSGSIAVDGTSAQYDKANEFNDLVENYCTSNNLACGSFLDIFRLNTN